MALENKLGLTSSADLAREEERLSKKKAVELFENDVLDTLPAGKFSTLQAIHKYLFEDIYDFAGKLRTVNLAKGNFRFAPLMYLEAALANIGKMPQSTFDEIIGKYVEMNIAHPFREGNTRATAVFMIKYMKTFGFRVNNDAFEKNSWYFRNALVRANYTNLQKGVHATTKFLEMFFSNLLLGTEHELKNRYMHIDYVEESHPQSINSKIPKYQFNTLDCSLEELAVLELVAQNPAIKQQELVTATGRSIATVKRIMKSLQDKNYIRRERGKRYGKWELLV